MSKVNVLDILYSEEKSPLDFHFDSLCGPNISCFFNENEIIELYNIARSNKLAGNVKKKKELINNIVQPKGFKRIFSGTNRVIYRYMEDLSFCLKIAFDTVGLSDSLREYENQFYLKPFCVKIFDTHPTGTIATVEYVQPIRTMIEFVQVAEEVFDLIVNRIIGKYVLDDIGCVEFFQNYGVRKGFGPVLLDFPYMYKLDGNKLYCQVEDKVTHKRCNGVIDYDSTFDNIVCTKCGKRYFAKELKRDIDNELIFIKGVTDMSKVYIYRGDNLIDVKGGSESDFIDRSESRIIPSTIQEQMKEDYIIIGKQNRMEDKEIKIPSFERKINNSREEQIRKEMKEEYIQRQKSTFIPEIKEETNIKTDEDLTIRNLDEVEIPTDLGEIISANSLDNDDDNTIDYSKFGLSESESEFPDENVYNESNNQEDVSSNFEKIKKKQTEKNNDDFY